MATSRIRERLHTNSRLCYLELTEFHRRLIAHGGEGSLNVDVMHRQVHIQESQERTEAGDWQVETQSRS